MDDTSIWGIMVLVVVCLLWAFGLGYITSTPDKLDNGCLVYEEKIYCEEVSE